MMASDKAGGKEPDIQQMMPEKLSADSVLSLALLNIKTLGSLTDIRPFDMEKEIEESGKGGGGLMDLMMLGMMSKQDKQKQTATPPAVKTAPKKK